MSTCPSLPLHQLLSGWHHQMSLATQSEQVKALKRENADLKRATEILKAAARFFAAELDRPHLRS